MFSIDTFIKVVPIVLSVPAILLSLIAFLLQRATFKKNFLEDNLFDIDCKGLLISNIATRNDDTDTDVDEKIETRHSPDGKYTLNVKDALLIKITLVFSTAGRCFLLDSDISEIRFENSFKKIKITGFISSEIIDNINGFASDGFTLKSMNFQYVIPKMFFADDDEFTRVVIESKKIKNSVAIFETSIHLKEVIQNITPGFIITKLDKVN